MSRTIPILLGIGLAALALVGCSKNNIAGPQDRGSAATFVKMALPMEESFGGGKWDAREETGRLVEVKQFEVWSEKPAVLDADLLNEGELTDGAANQTEGRPDVIKNWTVLEEPNY